LLVILLKAVRVLVKAVRVLAEAVRALLVTSVVDP
jgi:hypothetical protein